MGANVFWEFVNCVFWKLFKLTIKSSERKTFYFYRLLNYHEHLPEILSFFPKTSLKALSPTSSYLNFNIALKTQDQTFAITFW